ncbi:hypothetical protein Drorol1_Dr00001347, partial [Drosera rotundifolia]
MTILRTHLDNELKPFEIQDNSLRTRITSTKKKKKNETNSNEQCTRASANSTKPVHHSPATPRASSTNPTSRIADGPSNSPAPTQRLLQMGRNLLMVLLEFSSPSSCNRPYRTNPKIQRGVFAWGKMEKKRRVEEIRGRERRGRWKI